ncbi:unnamed protein product [Heligmosomoides polygyrus]|uniref:UBR-type domain-containing protein n=1 Tax=Heligmosomoides polygyrus TaxID=6339 RepID=A0A183F582_HELPZ|nr:unnamed protein product [Heligmosomoides polygyrus]
MEGVAGCGEAVDAVQVVAVEEEEDTTSALDDQILLKKQFRQFEDVTLAKYEYSAFYFCNGCDGSLTNSKDLCGDTGCRLRK